MAPKWRAGSGCPRYDVHDRCQPSWCLSVEFVVADLALRGRFLGSSFSCRARPSEAGRNSRMERLVMLEGGCTPLFRVSRGNKGVTGEWLASRGNKGVRGEKRSKSKFEGSKWEETRREWRVSSKRTSQARLKRSALSPLFLAAGPRSLVTDVPSA